MYCKIFKIGSLLVLLGFLGQCKHEKKENLLIKDANKALTVLDSISIGKEFTLYKLPYAYDHTIIFNSRSNKWHLYGIIADNKEFIHLTADSLTQIGWEKQESFRYKGQEIWAPHIIEHKDTYYMYYTSIGEPRQIRYAISKDLYNWEHPQDEPLFAYANEYTDNQKNKDPMVFKNGNQWIMYFSMLKDDKHWVVGYSTSNDLIHWDGPKICFDEQTENPGVESPFVVQRGEYYYLTLSARPTWPHGGQDIFRSKSPFSWKTTDLVKRINPWHAAEIVRDLDGKWYYSRSSGNESDFRMAELFWNDGLDDEETSMPIPNQ
ncbi:family 43 glycosylhydrolase [Maribacter ulvicola]|nr:family 43 glycosylhydrolase [Maribacter ulvicola]